MQIQPSQLSRARAETTNSLPKSVMHTYTAQEKTSFSNYLNQRLTDVPPPAAGVSGLSAGNMSPQLRAQYLPIDPNTEDLFNKLKSGVLLCAIFNKIRPYTIPEKKIIEQPRNHFEQLQNCTEAIRAGNELGFSIVNIGPEDIIAGKPHLVLGLVWQIVRYDLVQSVNLTKHPEIVALIEPNEEVSTFVELTPEVNLLRWFNYHLKQAGSPRRVTNFSRDLADSENYIMLLSEIAPAMCDRSILNERDINKRAQYVIDSSAKLGCSQFISPLDIVNGNWKLNLAFVAELFHKRNALHVNEQQASKLKEVEDLMRARLRKEEDEMRDKLAQEERRIKAEMSRMEEEHRAKLAREEEAMRNRFQSTEPPYPNTSIQQQTSYGMAAKDFAKPSDSSSFLASQTDPYTSQRRFSAQSQETVAAAAPPPPPLNTSFKAYPGPPLNSGLSSSQIHTAAPGLYSQNTATSGYQYGTSSMATSNNINPTPPIPPPYGVQGSFQETSRTSYRSEEFAPPPPPPGFLPTNLHSSSTAVPPVPPRMASAANVLQRSASTTTGTGPTVMSYERTTSTTTLPVAPPPMISARQAYELNSSSYSGSGVTTGMPMMAPTRTENIYVQQQSSQPLDSVYHPSPIVRTDSSWMLNNSRPPPPPNMYPGPSLQVAPVSTIPAGYTSTTGTAYGAQPPPAGYGLRFPIRVLRVYVFEARNVAKKDLMGLMSSDPYVVVERKGAMRKTKACHSTRRPVWYEEFEFPLVDWHESIYVTMWDRDKLGKDDFLGQVILTKEDFLTDTERWYTLRSRPGSHDRVSGEIRLGLRAA